MTMERTKKSIILKTWERCRSLGRTKKSPFAEYQFPPLLKRGFSEKNRVAPEGCLMVCVGTNREKFMIKMEYVNHPLFKTLLDEAELEYGYAIDGPLVLPCEIDIFQSLLWEIEQDSIARSGCSFPRGGVYKMLSPPSTPMIYRVQSC